MPKIRITEAAACSIDRTMRYRPSTCSTSRPLQRQFPPPPDSPSGRRRDRRSSSGNTQLVSSILRSYHERIIELALCGNVRHGGNHRLGWQTRGVAPGDPLECSLRRGGYRRLRFRRRRSLRLRDDPPRCKRHPATRLPIRLEQPPTRKQRGADRSAILRGVAARLPYSRK